MNRKRLKKWMQLCAMTLALTLLAACGGAAIFTPGWIRYSC